MGKNDFCCAHGCSNNRKKNPELKFYRIPKDETRRKAWLQRIRRENFQPTDNTRLCSAHFVDGSKTDNPNTPGYIPSIFSHSHQAKDARRLSRNSSKAGFEPMIKSEPKPKKRRIFQELQTVKGRPKQLEKSLDDHKIWSNCLAVSHPLKEHDYCKSQIDPDSMKVDASVIEELRTLNQKNSELQKENDVLKSRCVTLDSIRFHDKKFFFFTGFPNCGTFEGLFKYLNSVALQTKKTWIGSNMELKENVPSSNRGAKSKLSLEEELFLCVLRIRLGLTQTDLAVRFNISESTVSRIFSTWINLLHFNLKELCQMPEYCDELGKAKQFSGFPDLKVIVDCTEIFTEKPSSLKANKEIYSNYKSHTTFKFLVAINACGAIAYVSKGWGGRTSDKFITENSVDFIATLQPGDEVMADRGFDISDIMSNSGVKLTIPDFKGQGRSQLKAAEGRRSEKIAEARIHVERAIQRIKTYHILDREVRLSMSHLAEQIFTVCAYLVNFQPPILK